MAAEWAGTLHISVSGCVGKQISLERANFYRHDASCTRVDA